MMQKLHLSTALTISIGKSLLSNNTTDTYEPNMEQEYFDYGDHIIKIFCGTEVPNFSRIAEWFEKSKNKSVIKDCSIEDLFNFPIRFQRYLATGLVGVIELSTIQSQDECKELKRRCETFVHTDLVALNQELLKMLISHDHYSINIAGLDTAAVFVALYSAASRLLHNTVSESWQSNSRVKSSLSIEEAREILKDQQCFDYFQGIVFKLNFSERHLNTFSYEQNYGFKVAQKAIHPLRIAFNRKINSMSLQDHCVSVIKSDIPKFWSRLPHLREGVREKYRELETNPVNLFKYELSDFIRKYPCQTAEAKIFLRLFEGCHAKGNRYNAINTVLRSKEFKEAPEEQRNQLNRTVLPLLTARFAKQLDDQKMSIGILEVLSNCTPKAFDAQCIRQLMLCRNLNSSESVKKIHTLLKEDPPCIADQKSRVRKPLFEMIKKYNERTKKAKEMLNSESDQVSKESTVSSKNKA
jgi:hypothetical protein